MLTSLHQIEGAKFVRENQGKSRPLSDTQWRGAHLLIERFAETLIQKIAEENEVTRNAKGQVVSHIDDDEGDGDVIFTAEMGIDHWKFSLAVAGSSTYYEGHDSDGIDGDFLEAIYHYGDGGEACLCRTKRDENLFAQCEEHEKHHVD